MPLSQSDIQHIFERLRSGVVPERGLEAFAVGIDRQRNEIARLLDLAAGGEGVFKFLRGGYGCGKTFMARLALQEAQARGFATSFVVVSPNDTHFDRFDDVYRKVVQELSTSTCPRGALNDIVDRWIAKVEDGLIEGGADENSAEFDTLVQKRMEEEIASKTQGKAPYEFSRVLRAVFSLKQQNKVDNAAMLLSWLSGSQNISAQVKTMAGVKGAVTSQTAMDYLHGILEITKAAGYQGLVIVIDEAETILRMRADTRAKSLNGIRQIIDAADRYKKLFWIFTGTPEFFDTKRGVAGLQPLHDRIQLLRHEGGLTNPRGAQLELKPFDAARLKEVALRLRELYPTPDRNRLETRIKPVYIERLVESFTAGFKGDVGAIPRQFLRHLVDVLDLATDHDDFNPDAQVKFETKALNEDEARKLKGQPPYDPEPDDDKGYSQTQVEF